MNILLLNDTTNNHHYGCCAVMNALRTIDCSAAHFAGALNVPTQCILTGYPTWQWPLDGSLYTSVRCVAGHGGVPQEASVE